MKHAKRNLVSLFAVFVTLLWRMTTAYALEAPVKMTVGHPVAQSTIPLWIAQEQGFFAKYGIEPQLVAFVRPGPTILASLIAGQLQFAHVASTAVIGAASQGMKLKFLASFTGGRLNFSLLASSNIKQPEELRGKRVGVTNVGSGQWMMSMLALEKLGIDPKRDNIRLVVVGDQAQVGQALEAGVVDAAVLAPGQAAPVNAKGFSVVADAARLNIPNLGIGPLVTAGYLQQHAETCEKYLKALVEGVAFSHSARNKTTMVKTLMKRLRITDEASAEEAYQGWLLISNRRPYMALDGLRNVQRLLVVQNPTVANVKVEDLVEDRFVRKLDESGFIDGLYHTYGVK